MSTVVKIYKIKANEAIIPLTLGKCKVTAHFKGGNLIAGRWATLTTSDPIVQLAVEKNPRYGRAILLEKAILPEAEVDEVTEGEKSEVKVVEGPTSINEVLSYLRDIEGLETKDIKTMAAVKKQIARLNLSFPNVNLG